MNGENLKVNEMALNDEILYLKEILQDYNKTLYQLDYNCKGKTNDEIKKINDNYNVIDSSIKELISSTVDFLVNARDGYIDVDKGCAEALKRLEDEVGI